MPKQNIKELYKIGSFEFERDYRIKISENTHSIGSETETIELFDLRDLEQLQREKYKILHIGAIQVAAKPLTRLGLDKPICICLRDARHNQFQDSLLGLMQANTSFGPVYFTCYPSLELDCMNDQSIHKALTLNIQTQKTSEIERGTPRLVINCKPLNKVLQWIRYPIPNKKDLIQRLYNATIFSKFDRKLGF